MHLESSTLLTGMFSGLLITILTLVFSIRKQAKRPVTELQSGITVPKTHKINRSLVVAIITLISSLCLILFIGLGQGTRATTVFFISGFLILGCCISFTSYFIDRLSTKSPTEEFTLGQIGLSNVVRRKSRSLLLVGLLSSGLFIIFTVGANRHGEIQDPFNRSSGTGGFSLFGQTDLPLLYDLNTQKAKDFYGLNEISKWSVNFVPIRVHAGDDASCLNLNRVSAPQLIGLDPSSLEKREAFTFSSRAEGMDKDKFWSLLDQNLSEEVLPGIADETVIIWGLGKSVGDTITYFDENGNRFYVKLIACLANSIFQGNIIISEKHLIQKFPSSGGYRMLLIDAPKSETDSLSMHLSWALQDLGIEIIPAAKRLQVFNQVENTYLSIFLILGGFGLILGTIGIGIVVTRNVLERRGELGLLKAIGFDSKKIQKILQTEHIFLLITGSLGGLVASLLAVLPALLTPGNAIPYITLTTVFLVILANGLIWTQLAISITTRGNLLSALRDE
jgi:putative ABC transport system permease protein